MDQPQLLALQLQSQCNSSQTISLQIMVPSFAISLTTTYTLYIVDTILKSNKFWNRKKTKKASFSSAIGSAHRLTIKTCMVKSKDMREEIISDYIKKCSIEGISLEKVENTMSFLIKYSKQAGALQKGELNR